MIRTRTTLLVGFALFAAACGGGSDGAESAGDSPTTTSAAPTTTTTSAPTTTTTTVPPLPDIKVTVTGEEELVFDYSESACGTDARPDLPTRAFRVDDTVSLTLAHPLNHRLVGPDFESLTVDCAPILVAEFDNDPAAHAHHEWLAATYVDGSTVHAVIHNEFHGWESELADSRRDRLNTASPIVWHQLARSADGTVADMAPTDAGFTAGGLCLVDFWGGHPDTGCDAVSRWISDRDGELVVDLDATKVGVGGDGVLVDLRVDGVEVWSAALSDADPTQATSLTVAVAIGSTIDFGVNAIADSSFDATEMRMVITPDGDRCTLDDFSCQLVELTTARSDDGGATFERTGGLVASPSGRYEHDAGFGARWQPSNIVAHPDGSHVMIVQLDESRTDNAQYSCLFRTTDLDDPTAWRGWDGEDFTITAVDAYADDAAGADGPRCARVGPAPISGLVWSDDLELFIASGGFAQFGTNGHYLLFSRDLLTWSDPVLVRPAEFVFTTDTPPWEPYGTLIDHGSASASFDTVGTTPHLYFTRINDPLTLDFDLIRIPLELSVTG